MTNADLSGFEAPESAVMRRVPRREKNSSTGLIVAHSPRASLRSSTRKERRRTAQRSKAVHPPTRSGPPFCIPELALVRRKSFCVMNGTLFDNVPRRRTLAEPSRSPARGPMDDPGSKAAGSADCDAAPVGKRSSNIPRHALQFFLVRPLQFFNPVMSRLHCLFGTVCCRNGRVICG
jgi:hypothetical protein